jgi:hypothetical protein
MNLEFEEVCDVESTVETTFVYEVEVGLFRRRDQMQKISGERPSSRKRFFGLGFFMDLFYIGLRFRSKDRFDFFAFAEIIDKLHLSVL